MAFVPFPNGALVEIRGTQNGEVCEMTMGVVFPTAYDIDDLESLASVVDDWASDNLVNNMGTDANYAGVNVRGLSSSVDLEAFDDTNAGAGEAGVGSASANVAVVATKLSGLTGRSARGRMYFWGIPLTYFTDIRHISSAAQTAYNVACDNLLTAINANGWTPVIISRQHNGVALSTAVGYTVLDLLVRDTRIDSQRGRLGKS